MEYTKSQLRNNNMPLLRRVQRKIEVERELKNKLMDAPIKVNNNMLQAFSLEPIEKECLIRNSRLDLYNKRKGKG